jgi:hypothetical protein
MRIAEPAPTQNGIEISQSIAHGNNEYVVEVLSCRATVEHEALRRRVVQLASRAFDPALLRT